MAPRRKTCLQTTDLFTWTPPVVTEQVPTEHTSVNVEHNFTVALKKSIRDFEREAEEQVGDLMDTLSSVASLRNYLSEANKGHNLRVDHLIEIFEITGDPRPLAEILDAHGMAIIRKEFVPVVQLAMARKEHEARERKIQSLQWQADKALGL